MWQPLIYTFACNITYWVVTYCLGKGRGAWKSLTRPEVSIKLVKVEIFCLLCGHWSYQYSYKKKFTVLLKALINKMLMLTDNFCFLKTAVPWKSKSVASVEVFTNVVLIVETVNHWQKYCKSNETLLKLQLIKVAIF